MIRAGTALLCGALCALLLSGAGRPPMRLGPKPAAAPARLVTLAPSLTETVMALGDGECSGQ